MDKLDAIFLPKSTAVIGASTQKGKVGHDIFANILYGESQGTTVADIIITLAPPLAFLE